jgi:CRP/FNR family transcriptional regulator, cyclic AMP receptor protein
VRVHEPNTTGPGLTISMVEAPTIVTQTGFAAWPPRTMVVEALEPSDLRILEGEAFDDLVRRNPEVGVKTIRLLGERLSTCEDRLSGLVHKEVPARLASLILGLSEHQGIMTADSGRKIPTRYTHNQLASMVGSNREALTRALGRLRRAGAVEVKNRRIHVTDADALERLAEERR